MPIKQFLATNPGYILRILLLIVFPAICLTQVRHLSFSSAMFPVVTCCIMLAVGFKQLVIREKDNARDGMQDLLKIIVILIIFCSLLDVIGFYPDAFLLSLSFYLHFDRPVTWKKLAAAILVSLVITLVMFVFFYYGLQLLMPEGVFFEQ